MDIADSVIMASIILIIGTMIVSGPLVSGITLTEARGPPSPEQGHVSVEDASLPTEGRIKAADFGAANYHIIFAPAEIHLARSTGAFVISYSVTVPSLDVEWTTTHIFSDVGTRLSVPMEPAIGQSEQITQQTYSATLALSVRDSTGTRTISKRNVTIRMSE